MKIFWIAVATLVVAIFFWFDGVILEKNAENVPNVLAIALCPLFGILAGIFIKSRQLNAREKMAVDALLVLLGLLYLVSTYYAFEQLTYSQVEPQKLIISSITVLGVWQGFIIFLLLGRFG